MRRLDVLLVLLQLHGVEMVRERIRGRLQVHRGEVGLEQVLLVAVAPWVVHQVQLRVPAGRHLQTVEIGLLKIALERSRRLVLLLLRVMMLVRVLHVRVLLLGLSSHWLRKLAIVGARVNLVRQLHLSAIHLHGAPVNVVLARRRRYHLLLHGTGRVAFRRLLKQRLHCLRLCLVHHLETNTAVMIMVLAQGACLDGRHSVRMVLSVRVTTALFRECDDCGHGSGRCGGCTCALLACADSAAQQVRMAATRVPQLQRLIPTVVAQPLLVEVLQRYVVGFLAILVDLGLIRWKMRRLLLDQERAVVAEGPR